MKLIERRKQMTGKKEFVPVRESGASDRNFSNSAITFDSGINDKGKYVVGRQNFVDRHLADRLLSKNFRRHDTLSTQHFVDKHFVEIFSSTRHFVDKHFVDTTLRRNFFVDTNMQKSKSC